MPLMPWYLDMAALPYVTIVRCLSDCGLLYKYCCDDCGFMGYLFLVVLFLFEYEMVEVFS